MKYVVYFAQTVLALTALMRAVEACTCFPGTLEESLSDSALFVRARVQYLVPGRDANYYLLNVEQTYKGCNVPAQIWVSATKNCAACCIFLNVGRSYVFPFSSNVVFHQINSCEFIRDFSALSEDDVSFLDTQTVCCHPNCNLQSSSRNSPRKCDKWTVFCFLAPCLFASPPCEEAVTCVDNYCGGCFTDWLTETGEPACE